MLEIIELVKERIVPGTTIPRPKSKDLIVKKWTDSNGGGITYSTLSYRKTVTIYELVAAYEQLMSIEGQITRQWFEKSVTHSKSRPCNFTALGGIFVVLGLAKYVKPGIYRIVDKNR